MPNEESRWASEISCKYSKYHLTPRRLDFETENMGFTDPLVEVLYFKFCYVKNKMDFSLTKQEFEKKYGWSLQRGNGVKLKTQSGLLRYPSIKNWDDDTDEIEITYEELERVFKERCIDIIEKSKTSKDDWYKANEFAREVAYWSIYSTTFESGMVSLVEKAKKSAENAINSTDSSSKG
jgi:hypothetical protein